MRDRKRSRVVAAARVTVPLLAAAASWPVTAGADDTCANAAFRTGPSSALADCRAYERVSPADKAGNDVDPNVAVLAADDGNGVLFAARGSFAGDGGSPLLVSYAATRDGDWTANGTDERQQEPVVNIGVGGTEGYSLDGSKTIFTSRAALTPGAIPSGTNIYLRDVRAPNALTLVAATASADAFKVGSSYAGNRDFSTVIITSQEPLLPGDTSVNGVRLAYRFSAGRLQRVDTLQDPATFDSQRGTVLLPAPTQRPLSTDGRRLTYERDNVDPDVYQWEDGTRTLVSHTAGSPTTEGGGTTPVASPDGSAVTFTSPSALTAASLAGAPSIYRWSAATNTNVDLLAGADGRPDTLSDVRVRAVSSDGNDVWFTSTDPVADGQPLTGKLYVIDVAAKVVRAVQDVFPDTGPTYAFSPDATAVAILAAPCTDFRCTAEISTYRADAPDAGTVCVTCGTPALGSPSLGSSGVGARAATSVLDDGRLFFSTGAALDLADVNGVSDVYEYRPGQASRLISDGRSVEPATFGTAGADGRDVFYRTAEQLVPSDDDDLIDLYDARVGGGIAAQQVRPVQAASCTGDACRPPASPAPAAAGLSASAATPPAPPAAPPGFSVATPSKAALRAAARSGRLTLRVRVGKAGTVSAGARATVRGTTRTVALRTVRVAKASTVSLRLTLSRAARAALRRRGSLSLRVTVAYSERTNRVRKTIRLTAARQKGGRS